MVATTPNVFAFRSQFPEFDDPDDTKDADIQNWLNTAKLWVDEAKWGDDYAIAVMCLAAHMMVYSQSQIALGLLGGTMDLYPRSIGFGERRVMYGERRFGQADQKLAPGDSQLNETFYGQLYLQLRNKRICPVAVV